MKITYCYIHVIVKLSKLQILSSWVIIPLHVALIKLIKVKLLSFNDPFNVVINHPLGVFPSIANFNKQTKFNNYIKRKIKCNSIYSKAYIDLFLLSLFSHCTWFYLSSISSPVISSWTETFLIWRKLFLCL